MRGLAAAVAVVAAVASCTPDAERHRPGAGPSPARGDPGERRAWLRSACSLPEQLVVRIQRDFYRERSPELTAVPSEPNYFGGFVGTSHSGPWDYVQRVPFVFYGPGYIRRAGTVRPDREVTMADVAPTLAELLGTDFPADRPGRALTEVLLPESQRSGIPRLIVTVVWDGGGWNVLEAWPDAWPHLKALARRGASVVDGIVGSSPSNTPPSHTNLGTGAFPRQHGIVDIDIRQGADTVDSFDRMSPEYVEIPTLADLYDVDVGNRAQIGMFGYNAWHLGMMSRGSVHPGGDRDVAAIVATRADEIVGPPGYRLPRYVNSVPGLEDDVATVDGEDGEIDGLWMGNDVFSNTFDTKSTPAWTMYQTRIVKEILEREGFGRDAVADLFFVNYKQPDLVGHIYNMLSPEEENALVHTDDELGELVGFLDELVGRRRWVVIVTADHGQTPLPESTGAWPVSMDEVVADAARHLGGPASKIFDRTRPGHFWLNMAWLRDNDATLDDVATFFTRYTIRQNIAPERELRAEYEDRLDERVFSAAFPTAEIDAIAGCVMD